MEIPIIIENVYDLKDEFYREGYDMTGFQDVPVPGVWQNYGYDHAPVHKRLLSVPDGSALCPGGQPLRRLCPVAFPMKKDCEAVPRDIPEF